MTQQARNFLSQDSVLAELIANYGPLSLPRGNPDLTALARIIVGQQLSGAAARTIFSRLRDRINSLEIEPCDLIDMAESEFLEVGISRAKTLYLKGISNLLLERPNFLEDIKKMSDLDAINHLISVKGIGAWSANIFLLFDSGRKDIFPIGVLTGPMRHSIFGDGWMHPDSQKI